MSDLDDLAKIVRAEEAARRAQAARMSQQQQPLQYAQPVQAQRIVPPPQQQPFMYQPASPFGTAFKSTLGAGVATLMIFGIIIVAMLVLFVGCLVVVGSASRKLPPPRPSRVPRQQWSHVQAIPQPAHCVASAHEKGRG